MSRKHKDLNRAHALLEGEGWHIENVGRQQHTTERKDKRRCVHYNKQFKTCEIMSCKYPVCIGSSQCPTYREY